MRLRTFIKFVTCFIESTRLLAAKFHEGKIFSIFIQRKLSERADRANRENERKSHSENVSKFSTISSSLPHSLCVHLLFSRRCLCCFFSFVWNLKSTGYLVLFSLKKRKKEILKCEWKSEGALRFVEPDTYVVCVSFVVGAKKKSSARCIRSFNNL